MPAEPSTPPTGRTPLPVVQLEAAGGRGPRATADARVTVGGRPLHLRITVPTGPAHVWELLPVFQGLTDAVVGVAEQNAIAEGQHVSCQKGCGACCRQLVPVAAVEARALARLVAALPEPRQAQVRGRFAEVVRRLGAAGLLGRLRDPGPESGEQLRPLGLDYFLQGVACPFLEDESCSIHRDRPLACREYLVTSPAAECARPTPEAVRCVPLPARASDALRAVDREAPAGAAGW